MRRTRLSAVIVLLAPLLAGCAKPPVLRVSGADAAAEALIKESYADGKKVPALEFLPAAEQREYSAGYADILILDGNQLPALAEAGALLDLESFFTGAKTSAEAELSLPPVYSGGSGGILAVFFHAGAGAFAYRASAAQKYLGFSAQDELQKQLGDINHFIAAAYVIGENSARSCRIISAAEELYPFFYRRENTETISGHYVNNYLSGGESGNSLPDTLESMGYSREKLLLWYLDTVLIFRNRRWDASLPLIWEGNHLSGVPGHPDLPPSAAEASYPGAPPPAPNGGTELFARILGAGAVFSAADAADWRIIAGALPDSKGGLWLAVAAGSAHKPGAFAVIRRVLEKVKDADTAPPEKDAEIRGVAAAYAADEISREAAFRKLLELF
ncbi:MAG: hypothetical protein LBB82_04325 [Treponema sp.]|jgi:hypothetical protein|nr:hypothetical protein [Treponema sp.]